MTLTEVFAQFRRAEKELSHDFGQFQLFGLFERDDIPGRYDVVVSGAGLKSSLRDLTRLTDSVRNAIGSDWWPYIGKFVVLDTDDPFVQAVLNRTPDGFVQHELFMVNNLLYEGETIRSAAIITVQKHPVENVTAQAA